MCSLGYYCIILLIGINIFLFVCIKELHFGEVKKESLWFWSPQSITTVSFHCLAFYMAVAFSISCWQYFVHLDAVCLCLKVGFPINLHLPCTCVGAPSNHFISFRTCCGLSGYFEDKSLFIFCLHFPCGIIFFFHLLFASVYNWALPFMM